MNTRHLFLVGYDISEHPRRRRALRDVQHHALGGQKSFYECWLFAFSPSRVRQYALRARGHGRDVPAQGAEWALKVR